MSRYLAARTNWRDDYMRAIDKAAQISFTDNALLDASTQLCDRLAVLEAENALLRSQKPSRSLPTTNAPVDLEMQRDLAEAMRQKGANEMALRTAVTELDRLRVRVKEDAQSLKELRTERTHYVTKMRDLEHELREKRRLLDTLQDEMITLNLQVTIAEKERDKAKDENTHLIDRFIKYKSQHVDAASRVATELPDRKRRPKESSRSGSSRPNHG